MAFFQNLLKVGNSYRKKTLPRIYHSIHRRISAKVNNLLLQPKPAKIQKTKPDKLINQFHYCVCAFVLSPAGLPVQSNLASPLRERERGFHSLSAKEWTKIYKKHRKHSGNRYLEWLAREPGPRTRSQTQEEERDYNNNQFIARLVPVEWPNIVMPLSVGEQQPTPN